MTKSFRNGGELFQVSYGKSGKGRKKQLSPKVRDLRGIINTDDNFDCKQILTEELSEKYEV